MLDIDRIFLQKTWELARAARKPPARLALPVEPTWAAVLANREKILAQEVFVPGDKQDAVRALCKSFDFSAHSMDQVTLYLTIEPFSTYERLAPVTESIRVLGVQRVCVGAENPWNRARGKGIASLEKQGIELVLADGEVARQCQLLYEDYAKVQARSLPVLRLVWELDGAPIAVDRLGFSVSTKTEYHFQHDAILWSDLSAAKQYNGEAWVLVLDRKRELTNTEEFTSKKVLVFQGDGAERRPGFYTVPDREEGLDLASVLRKIKDLGLLSVLCRGDEALFQSALESGLVDSVLSFVSRKNRSVAGVLSHLSQSLVQGEGGGHSLRLLSPRILEEAVDSLLVEAGVKMQ